MSCFMHDFVSMMHMRHFHFGSPDVDATHAEQDILPLWLSNSPLVHKVSRAQSGLAANVHGDHFSQTEDSRISVSRAPWDSAQRSVCYPGGIGDSLRLCMRTPLR